MLWINPVTANNVVISNVSNLAGTTITFDITWDNSWFVTTGPSNFDGVWIYVKHQQPDTTQPNCESTLPWSHAKIDPTGSSVGGGVLTLETVTDSMGVFVRRLGAGTGNIASSVVTLVLNIPAGTYNYSVLGIEMVYVPTASFELGDGISTNTFNSITIDGSTGVLTTAVLGGGLQANVAAAYPNGYNDFWCMKYELSQNQYVDFLNHLTYDQQNTRTVIAPNSPPGTDGVCAMQSTCLNRNGIKLIQAGTANTTPGVYANNLDPTPTGVFNDITDGQTIAANYLSWDDLMAYLDWSGLRPMTNLEFDKVSRGTLTRLGNEYIWGTTNITKAESIALTFPGETSEISIALGTGLSAYGSSSANGPLRVGFAATASTSRETAGAGYYGAMDLGGNVWEMVLGGRNQANAGYKVTYANVGDGTLTSTGTANVTNWPQISSNVCCWSYYWHFEMRGGDYTSPTNELRVSDRSNNNSFYGCDVCGNNSVADTQRKATQGGRGVR